MAGRSDADPVPGPPDPADGSGVTDAGTEPAGQDPRAGRGRLGRSRGQEPRDPDLGSRGRALDRRSPLMVGFLGATGALVAYGFLSLLLDLKPVIVLVVIAAFLAVGLEPVTERLTGAGLSRGRAVAVVVLGVLLVIAGSVLVLVPVLVDQVVALSTSVPEWLRGLASNSVVQTLDENYQVIDRVQGYLLDGGLARNLFGGALGFGLALISGLVNAFFLLVLTLYFLHGLPTIKAAAYRLAPASRRDRVSRLGDEMLRNVGSYVSGAAVVALAAGVSALVFLVVVGLGEYALALALVVAVLDVIPLVGATIGASLVVAVGFATDVRTGIACLVFAVVYQQVENYVVYPRVMARTVDVPGAVILVAALTGATLLGVLGALLAVPVAASLLLLHREVAQPALDRR